MEYPRIRQGIKRFGYSTLLLLVLIITFLLPGCNKDDKTPARVETEIGVLIPFTGSASNSSESAQIVLDMVKRDVNHYFEDLNTRFSIKLTIEDTGSDPDKALESIEKLQQKGITTVVGPYTSANAAAILDYAYTHDMIVLSPASVATSLSIDDNLFRMLPDNRSQGEVVTALFLHDSIEALIPVVRNDIWGNGLIENIKEDLDPGMTMTDLIQYDPATFDVNRVVDQIQNALNGISGQYANAHVGILLLTFDEGTEILAASPSLTNTSETIWYGSSAYANNTALLHNSDAAEFALDHSFVCSVFGPDPDAQNLWEPIRDNIAAELGHIPDVFSLTLYDAVWLMALTWEKSLNSGANFDFKSALETTAKNYKGITGNLTFNEVGDRKNWSFDLWGLSLNKTEFDWKTAGYYKDGVLEID